MKVKILFLVLTIIVASLYFVPYVSANGLPSYLARNVASFAGAENSLVWAKSATAVGELYADRQGLEPSPTLWAIGAIGVGVVKSSNLNYFAMLNNASSATDVYIMGTDMVNGIPWTLSDNGTLGTDIYGLLAGLDGGAYNIRVKKTAPYNKLIDNFAVGGNQSWGLQLTAPPDFSDGVAKTCNITMTVVLH
jgi:hypothetical protein